MSLNNGHHFCGGALIHRKWVLTSAACASIIKRSKLDSQVPVHVRLGVHNITGRTRESWVVFKGSTKVSDRKSTWSRIFLVTGIKYNNDTNSNTSAVRSRNLWLWYCSYQKQFQWLESLLSFDFLKVKEITLLKLERLSKPARLRPARYVNVVRLPRSDHIHKNGTKCRV